MLSLWAGYPEFKVKVSTIHASNGSVPSQGLPSCFGSLPEKNLFHFLLSLPLKNHSESGQLTAYLSIHSLHIYLYFLIRVLLNIVHKQILPLAYPWKVSPFHSEHLSAWLLLEASTCPSLYLNHATPSP